MRAPIAALAAAMIAAAGTAPAQAQSDQEVILADPAFSMTFAAGYVATDLGLWQKHGIKVKTVAISRSRADSQQASTSRRPSPCPW